MKMSVFFSRLGVIHKGRPHKGEGVCQNRKGLKANVDVRKIIKLETIYWKKIIIDDNLQITE